MYALAMFVVGVTETLVNNRQMHYSMRMVMQLKVRAAAGRSDTFPAPEAVAEVPGCCSPR